MDGRDDIMSPQMIMFEFMSKILRFIFEHEIDLCRNGYGAGILKIVTFTLAPKVTIRSSFALEGSNDTLSPQMIIFELQSKF